MTRIARVSALAFGLAVLASCASSNTQMKSSGPVASVNPDFKVDHAQAETGRTVWVAKGCQGCHTVGLGRSSGPDLFGVVERRPVEWLKNWLKNPSEMIDSDPMAEGLYKQNNKVRMPNLHLTPQEIDALLNYVQAKTEERRSVANAGS